MQLAVHVQDKNLARELQSLFASPYLRVNTTTDVTGLEICGALKNVLALAAGGLTTPLLCLSKAISCYGNLLSHVPEHGFVHTQARDTKAHDAAQLQALWKGWTWGTMPWLR